MTLTVRQSGAPPRPCVASPKSITSISTLSPVRVPAAASRAKTSSSWPPGKRCRRLPRPRPRSRRNPMFRTRRPLRRQLRPPVGTTSADGREERKRFSRRRQTIANRLVEAQQTAAMLTTFNEVDMSAVMDLRARRKEAFKQKYGVNLGYMSFFTKAVVGALKAFPEMNSEPQGDELVLKKYYDIGVAVSTEEGLVVPVIRDADRKTFAEIEQEIADLATKARRASSPFPRSRAAPLPLPTAGSTAHSTRLRSSTCRRSASSACTPSRNARWRGTVRWSSAR